MTRTASPARRSELPSRSQSTSGHRLLHLSGEAEIAEILFAALVLKPEIQFRARQRIGGDAGEDAEPAEVALDERIAQMQAFVQHLDLLGRSEGAEHLARNGARRGLDKNEDDK